MLEQIEKDNKIIWRIGLYIDNIFINESQAETKRQAEQNCAKKELNRIGYYNN